MAGLAAEHDERQTVMTDATYLKAHRTATSMGVKKGGMGACIPARKQRKKSVEYNMPRYKQRNRI